MDSDNTHDPHYILDMAKSTTDADVVIGSRYIDGGKQLNVPVYRMFLSKIVNLLIHEITRIPAKDATSGYRCFKASALQNVKRIFDGKVIVSKGFEVSLEILLKTFWCNTSIKEVPILLDYGKKGGISKMKLFPTIKRYLSLFTKINKWRNGAAV